MTEKEVDEILDIVSDTHRHSIGNGLGTLVREKTKQKLREKGLLSGENNNNKLLNAQNKLPKDSEKASDKLQECEHENTNKHIKDGLLIYEKCTQCGYVLCDLYGEACAKEQPKTAEQECERCESIYPDPKNNCYICVKCGKEYNMKTLNNEIKTNKKIQKCVHELGFHDWVIMRDDNDEFAGRYCIRCGFKDRNGVRIKEVEQPKTALADAKRLYEEACGINTDIHEELSLLYQSIGIYQRAIEESEKRIKELENGK